MASELQLTYEKQGVKTIIDVSVYYNTRSVLLWLPSVISFWSDVKIGDINDELYIGGDDKQCRICVTPMVVSQLMQCIVDGQGFNFDLDQFIKQHEHVEFKK